MQNIQPSITRALSVKRKRGDDGINDVMPKHKKPKNNWQYEVSELFNQPSEILMQIFSYLSYPDLKSLKLTCKASIATFEKGDLEDRYLKQATIILNSYLQQKFGLGDLTIGENGNPLNGIYPVPNISINKVLRVHKHLSSRLVYRNFTPIRTPLLEQKDSHIFDYSAIKAIADKTRSWAGLARDRLHQHHFWLYQRGINQIIHKMLFDISDIFLKHLCDNASFALCAGFKFTKRQPADIYSLNERTSDPDSDRICFRSTRLKLITNLGDRDFTPASRLFRDSSLVIDLSNIDNIAEQINKIAIRMWRCYVSVCVKYEAARLVAPMMIPCLAKSRDLDEALQNSELPTVRRLLREGAEVLGMTNDGKPRLSALLRTKDLEVMQILARMPYIKGQCLIAAFETGEPGLIDFFLGKRYRNLNFLRRNDFVQIFKGIVARLKKTPQQQTFPLNRHLAVILDGLHLLKPEWFDSDNPLYLFRTKSGDDLLQSLLETENMDAISTIIRIPNIRRECLVGAFEAGYFKLFEYISSQMKFDSPRTTANGLGRILESLFQHVDQHGNLEPSIVEALGYFKSILDITARLHPQYLCEERCTSTSKDLALSTTYDLAGERPDFTQQDLGIGNLDCLRLPVRGAPIYFWECKITEACTYSYADSTMKCNNLGCLTKLLKSLYRCPIL